MRDRVFKTVMIILLIVFFVWIYWMSGIPCAYLLDFPTAIALVVGTILLYGVRYKKNMDIVKKRSILLSSLGGVAIVTLFIGIIGVLTQMTQIEEVFWGIAVALLTVPYTGLLWLAIELYFIYRASHEVDVYSEVNPSAEKNTLQSANLIEMERAILKQKYQLTPRETEIIGELLKGKTNREIAETLFISEMTVKKHMANIFAKVGVSNRQALTVLIHQKN